ncbi:peptidase S1, partial [Micromonospora sp. NPDC049799]
MTEYESDPQRRPAPSDAEPSHPTAELPRVERAQSDSGPGATPAVDGGTTDPAPTVEVQAVGDELSRTPEAGPATAGAVTPDAPRAGDGP